MSSRHPSAQGVGLCARKIPRESDDPGGHQGGVVQTHQRFGRRQCIEADDAVSSTAAAARDGRRQCGPASASGRVFWRPKWIAGLALIIAQAVTAAPAPVMIQGSPGRFEIAAVDPTLAHGVAAAAEEAWRILSAPLALPEAF